jgi:predicted phosphoribosyltransferase
MFADRADAGRLLGAAVRERVATASGAPIVLGLPRGGVPVAAEVAEALSCELDVLVVRKIGYPSNPEVAYGAIGPDGVVVTASGAAGDLDTRFERIRTRELDELVRRERLYRAGAAALDLRGRRAILVDDGIATGATAAAAVRAARGLGAVEVVVAVPVAAPDARDALAALADVVIVLECPADFWAVGQWYRDFGQTSDREVIAALGR